jgi:Putative peptidoglycan binding domain
MRKLLYLTGVVAFGLLGMAAQGATVAKKKSLPKKGSHPAVSAHKTSGTAATRSKTSTTSKKTVASRRGKKAPVRRTTWRNRQLSPTPERYKEIQEALSAKGYLPAGQANGKWDDASAEALKKFQADQNLNGTGKINSLSLIALGLGPKRETAVNSKPAVPAAPATPAAPSESTTQ